MLKQCKNNRHTLHSRQKCELTISTIRHLPVALVQMPYVPYRCCTHQHKEEGAGLGEGLGLAHWRITILHLKTHTHTHTHTQNCINDPRKYQHPTISLRLKTLCQYQLQCALALVLAGGRPHFGVCVRPGAQQEERTVREFKNTIQNKTYTVRVCYKNTMACHCTTSVSCQCVSTRTCVCRRCKAHRVLLYVPTQDRLAIPIVGLEFGTNLTVIRLALCCHFRSCW
jgi:hypothetical protein